MKIKSLTALNIILATILSASIFLVATTTSQSAYDPWVDINDDGYIELSDFFILSQHFGTSGTPINKTVLLLELQAKIDELNTTVASLEQRVSDLEGHSHGGMVVKMVSESFNAVTDAADGTLTVTFPGGSFVSAPDIIHCQVVLRAAAAGMPKGALAYPNLSGITTTQFDVEVVEHHGSSTTINGYDVTIIYLAIDLS